MFLSVLMYSCLQQDSYGSPLSSVIASSQAAARPNTIPSQANGKLSLQSIRVIPSQAVWKSQNKSKNSFRFPSTHLGKNKGKKNCAERFSLTFLDDYGVPVAPVVEYQLNDQNKLAQNEDMQNVGSLDGLVILDNVQSYNLFQHVSKDKEQGSGLGSVDYQEQDLLPGDADFRDDPRDEETGTSIVDNDHSDKISIGFKVDKTSDIITLLEKDRTKSINADISDQKIPEEVNFQRRDQGDAEKMSSQDKVEVKKENSPLEFINDLESLVFRERTLEKVNNVTSVEMFSNVMTMSQKTEEKQLSSQNGNKMHTKNSTIIDRQRQERMQLNQEKGDKSNRFLEKVEVEENDDVVYILYLSKDGLNDLSNNDDA